MTKKDVNQRLLTFIGELGIPVSQFERICGFSNGYVKSVGNSIGSDKIQRIMKEYPDLSIMWLITGIGDMLNSRTSIHNESGVVVNGDNSNSPIDNRHYNSESPDVLKTQIDELERTIGAKEELIKEQDARIKEQDARIKEQDARIKEQDARIKEQDARIKEQDARIDILLGQITQLHSQVDALIQMKSKQ